MIQDPFDGTEMERRILVGPYCKSDPVEKYPPARALAAAFWLSYFTLHWLLLLEVIEFTSSRMVTMLIFFGIATILTFLIAASDDAKERKK